MGFRFSGFGFLKNLAEAKEALDGVGDGGRARDERLDIYIYIYIYVYIHIHMYIIYVYISAPR